MKDKEIVKVENLSKLFDVDSGMWSKSKGKVHAVSNVSLSIMEGETLGLVGESGCGKSTLGRLILNLIEPTEGKVYFEDVDIHGLSDSELRDFRKNMQIIFQDPYASLNPRWTIRDIIAEPLETHHKDLPRDMVTARVRELMQYTGIRPEYLDRYPHQFSGGQRQRVGIARALALNPKFIVCDEPVSALDVSIQSQILNLLGDIQKEKGISYLFISHDLSVVRYLSDRVCVMFLGKVCELGITHRVYDDPIHPYTRFLLEAVPKPDPKRRKSEKEMLMGEIPSPVNPPPGCRFHTRCPYKLDICVEEEPEFRPFRNRFIACHRAEELAAGL